MKASNICGAAGTLQQNMWWTFIYLGHALSKPVIHYSLLLIVCCGKEKKLYGLEGRESCVGFFYCEYSIISFSLKPMAKAYPFILYVHSTRGKEEHGDKV
jgi:hypothetical protein